MFRLMVSGMCQLAQALKGDVDVVLEGLGDKSGSGEDVKRVLEMVRSSKDISANGHCFYNCCI